MTRMAIEKPNISERIEYFHIPMRYTLPKNVRRKISHAASLLFGLYSTFNSTYISYKEITALTGISSATIAGANRTLEGLGMVTAARAESCTRYTAKVRPAKIDYITVDARELTDRGIVFKGKFFHLTRMQHVILHTIMSHLKSEKINGQERHVFECVNNKLANIVGCDGSTVGDALKRLMRIKIISRVWKARNHHERSKYIVDRDFDEAYQARTAERKESAKRRAVEKSSADVREAQELLFDVKADIERHYAALRAAAIDTADGNLARANTDPAFREANQASKRLMIETARAEVFSPLRLPDLQAKLEAANAARRAALDKLGLSESDLTPRWKCEKCSDTGWLPNGQRCACYRPPTRRRAARRRSR